MAEAFTSTRGRLAIAWIGFKDSLRAKDAAFADATFFLRCPQAEDGFSREVHDGVQAV